MEPEKRARTGFEEGKLSSSLPENSDQTAGKKLLRRGSQSCRESSHKEKEEEEEKAKDGGEVIHFGRDKTSSEKNYVTRGWVVKSVCREFKYSIAMKHLRGYVTVSFLLMDCSIPSNSNTK